LFFPKVPLYCPISKVQSLKLPHKAGGCGPAGGVTRAILTCSSHFTDLALNELRRYHSDLTVLQHLAPGFILLQTPFSFDKLTRPWRHRLPIYLHHLFPVHAVVNLNGSYADLETLRQVAHDLAPSDTTPQIRIAVESGLSYSLAEVWEAVCERPMIYSPDSPTGRILSVLITQDQAEFRAYLGASWATQNLSPWPGGQIAFTEVVPNRAGFKLLEAIDAFALRLRSGDHALDLGAAPGAWTTLLRRRGLQVTAVAPTPLYPWLLFDPGVTYHPLLAEDYLIQCQIVFDLIVNDMKMDARDSARVMVDCAPHLRIEGIALMTLKLREQDQRKLMDHAFRILRRAYKIIRVRQLVSNRNEVTLFLRPND
jgi:23S rRNA (cytidine2498-2'-O)-methyltransferase